MALSTNQTDAKACHLNVDEHHWKVLMRDLVYTTYFIQYIILYRFYKIEHKIDLQSAD